MPQGICVMSVAQRLLVAVVWLRRAWTLGRALPLRFPTCQPLTVMIRWTVRFVTIMPSWKRSKAHSLRYPYVGCCLISSRILSLSSQVLFRTSPAPLLWVGRVLPERLTHRTRHILRMEALGSTSFTLLTSTKVKCLRKGAVCSPPSECPYQVPVHRLSA